MNRIRRYNENNRIESFSSQEKEIIMERYNESVNKSNIDYTSSDTNDYLETIFGFTSTDVQDWILDILDQYDFDFKVSVTMGRSNISIVIEFFYNYQNEQSHGSISRKNYPISEDQIKFVEERMKEYGILLIPGSLYYSMRNKFIVIEFKKDIDKTFRIK